MGLVFSAVELETARVGKMRLWGKLKTLLWTLVFCSVFDEVKAEASVENAF